MDRDDGAVKCWMEVWDYAGDAIYRGFLAERKVGGVVNGAAGVERTLFVFFSDFGLDGQGLKSGYVFLT